VRCLQGRARYNREKPSVAYKGHTIAEVLQMTVEQAADVFSAIPPARIGLRTWWMWGLGLLHQSSVNRPPTLSAARLSGSKLARAVKNGPPARTLY